MSETDINNIFPTEPEQSPDQYDSAQNVKNITVETEDKLLPSASDSSSDTTVDPSQNLENQTDWFAVAHKLRRYNRDLVKQVANLEQTLLESRQQIQAQIKQQESSDTIIIQQTEELRVSREQMANLYQEVESYHQSNQRQQILVETLSEQLEASQEQVAQLERECVFLQQQCNEQSHLLVQTNNNANELRSRLHRQQRQALQFKAALEKCLEVRESSNPNDCDISEESDTSELAISSSTFVPKVQAIQPWSNQFEQWDNQQEPEEQTLDSILSDAPKSEIPESTSDETSRELEAEPNLEIIPVNPEEELLRVSHTNELAPLSHTEEAPHFLLLDEFLLDAELSEETEVEGQVEAIEEPKPQTLNLNQAEETPIAQSSQEPKLLTSPLETDLEQSAHSPSPVLYPLRKKKRNSLAAVELPAFGRALSS